MSKAVVVFDFDKTLTRKDTVLGFYRAATPSRLRYLLKLPPYYLLAVLKKLGLIDNDTLKHRSIQLFLRGMSRSRLEEAGRQYARSIALNRLYEEDYLARAESNPIVSSASYAEYLRPLFPGGRVFASRIHYDRQDRATGLAHNMYGAAKVRKLREAGITAIDILYTDSYSDKPLMDIARKVFLVKNEEKTLIIDRSHEKEILRTIR